MNLWEFIDVITLKLLHNPGNIGASVRPIVQPLTKGM